MKIALLCIGDELLKGSTVNTNLAFIGDRLLANGIIPELSLEIPDRRTTFSGRLITLSPAQIRSSRPAGSAPRPTTSPKRASPNGSSSQ